jgi:hypothetical protein
MNAPSVGLDASWNAGLSIATHEQLQWGTQVIFTYGPLGFLNGANIWFAGFGLLSFAYLASLYVGFCMGLVWALRRLVGALPALAIAYFIVAVLPLVEQSIALAALLCMRGLEAQRSERAIRLLIVGGATFGAIEALIKLSAGPVIAAFFLIALIGLRARWWQVAAYLGLLGAELGALWLATGQSLGAVPEFLRNTYEIVSGFSDSMIASPDVAGWKVIVATAAAVFVTLGLVAASTRGSYRDNRARWWGVGLTALAAFTVFKEGVVRTDAGHLSLFFSTACVLWIALPWPRRRWAWMLAGAAAIVAIGWPVRPTGQPNNLDPVANVRNAFEQARNVFSGSRRNDLLEAGRASMTAIYALDPGTLAALHGHTVAVEPWEIGVAWAYRLDWDPLPVFQNYSAYTSRLDRLNAAAIESPDGPERLLRENVGVVYPEFPTRAIDNRFPGWDPPEQARAALCNFAVVRATERWQVLARTPDRCGPSRALGSAQASPGEAVRVPAPGPGPGEVVWARVEGVEVEGLERVATFLAHARTRHAIVNGTTSYRLVPGTAADGLMLRASGGLGGRGAFAQVPQARTIAVTGVEDDVRFEFFAMAVRRGRPAPSRPGT